MCSPQLCGVARCCVAHFRQVSWPPTRPASSAVSRSVCVALSCVSLRLCGPQLCLAPSVWPSAVPRSVCVALSCASLRLCGPQLCLAPSVWLSRTSGSTPRGPRSSQVTQSSHGDCLRAARKPQATGAYRRFGDTCDAPGRTRRTATATARHWDVSVDRTAVAPYIPGRRRCTAAAVPAVWCPSRHGSTRGRRRRHRPKYTRLERHTVPSLPPSLPHPAPPSSIGSSAPRSGAPRRLFRCFFTTNYCWRVSSENAPSAV